MGLENPVSAFVVCVGWGTAMVVRTRQPAGASKSPRAYEGSNIQAQPSPFRVEEYKEPVDKIDKVMKPHPVPISPYEIKRLIDQNNYAVHSRHPDDELNLENIWAELGIEIEGDVEFFPVKCTGNCDATISTVELGGGGQQENAA
jgi:hypothetical protein